MCARLPNVVVKLKEQPLQTGFILSAVSLVKQSCSTCVWCEHCLSGLFLESRNLGKHGVPSSFVTPQHQLLENSSIRLDSDQQELVQ